MRRIRCFTPELPARAGPLELPPHAAHHVSQVLRRRAGERIVLFDGSGREAPAELETVNRRRVIARLETVVDVDRESPLELTLGIAISRGDRMDTSVQKATELGASRIAPLLSERTVVKLDGERGARRGEHWRAVAVSACEQCGRNRVPTLDAAQPLRDWARDQAAREQPKLLLEPRAGRRLEDVVPRQPRPNALSIAIGPEGGFTEAEIALLEAAGFAPVSFGPRVLRAETAVVAAATAAQLLWGDLGGTAPSE